MPRFMTGDQMEDPLSEHFSSEDFNSPPRNQRELPNPENCQNGQTPEAPDERSVYSGSDDDFYSRGDECDEGQSNNEYYAAATVTAQREPLQFDTAEMLATAERRGDNARG